MRKIYCRRCSCLSKVSSAVFGCILFLFVLCCVKQGGFISVIHTTSITCQQFQSNALVESSSIPPRYLLIPYREFALRTSISCRSFKLDEPKKNLKAIHPKYSPYLRGTQPVMVPYQNVTYEDIEEFYTRMINSSTNGTQSNHYSTFSANISLENIPYEYENGMWHPIDFTSAQRTAFLVSLQGRDYNAKAFLLNIHAFARRQLLTYTVLIMEQVYPSSPRFNKGRLLNAGVRYLEQQQPSLNITCLILHDVDLIPENDANFYSCEAAYPKHTTTRIRALYGTRGYSRFYEFLIGGVLILTMDMYKRVNGFSNSYWGWGGEDDDLSLRLIVRQMCVVRPSYDVAVYVALPHPQGQRNVARFHLLAWATVRIDQDGYKQIEPMVKILEIRQLSIGTHLKLDVDIDHSLYRPPLAKKLESLVNKSYAYITTTSKTIPTSSSSIARNSTTTKV